MKTTQIKWLNRVVVLSPTTDLLGGHETDELSEAFRSVCTEGCQGIVVSCSNVRHINSTGLGVIVQCRREAQRIGTRIAICFPPRTVDALRKELFFKHLPRVLETEEEAVRFCSER